MVIMLSCPCLEKRVCWPLVNADRKKSGFQRLRCLVPLAVFVWNTKQRKKRADWTLVTSLCVFRRAAVEETYSKSMSKLAKIASNSSPQG